MKTSSKKGLVVGFTGASGVVYGLKLLEQCSILTRYYREINVVYTEKADLVMVHEMGSSIKEYMDRIECIDNVYGENDWSSSLASSSNVIGYDGVIVPASLNTVAKLANGIQDNLLLRVMYSILRIGGRLVVVVRETPLSQIDLKNLYILARNGAIILPASPAFYINPSTIDDLVLFIVGKILDVLGIEHNLYKRWGSTT